MKLTILLLATVMLHVSASSLAQKVTLTEKNAPLVDVFNHISNQTGYDFLFTGSDLKNAKPISINIKNVDLNDVLVRIFEGQPLNYTIENKSVVVTIKRPSMMDQLTDQLKTALKVPANIGGTVTDTLGNPLVGASVGIKGIAFSAQTDSKGNFNIPNVPQGKYTLVATYIGYEKSEVTIVNNGADLRIGFMLRRGTSQLDQVQVIAYGTAFRRYNISSMATVTAEDIEKQPVTNPLLALQGQVPGLAVTATSGIPGSKVLVQIRGQNTLNLNPTNIPSKPYDQPLFIIDGVPFASQNNNVNQFASLVAAQSNPGGVAQSVGLSPFNNISPADIESISILKDAAAISIYGTQGSNGVILITTKKGKPGPTTFNLNVNTGFNSVGRPVKMLNTEQYLQLRKDAFAADQLTPSSNPTDYLAYAPDLTIFDQHKYTNWQKVIYGRNTSNVDVHGSLSGGSANNTFLISTGYNRSNYNYPGDFSDQRYTLHSNVTHRSKDYRLTVGLTTDFGYEQNNSAGFGGANDVVLQPNLPDLRTPSGSLNWNYQGVDLTSYQFYSSLKQPTHLENYNFNAAFNISYKVLNGLTISTNIGYNRNNTNEHSIEPGVSQNPSRINRQANFSTNNFQTINIEPQINYNRNIGKGSLSVLVGSTYKKNTSNSSYVTGQGYSNDNFLGSINGAPIVNAMDDANIYRYSAGFARLNYIYDNEFIFDLTGRRDGSSNFGPGNQFGNFGSVGAGWIFSQREIFKKIASVFSYGKISGSYGTSGSDGIKAYQYQALYKGFPPYLPNFQGINPSYPANLYNPDYSWALKKSLNISLDLGFFDNHLLFNTTYYRNREGDQLVDYPLPIQVGLPSVLGNLNATVQNKGFEFSINSTNIQRKNFSWRSNFNISFNRNKLLAFPDLASSSYANVYEIGQPTSIVYGYRYKGVNAKTGLFEFYAKDGTVTSNPIYGPASTGGDQVPVANQEIKYMGGFGNTFTWKQFSLYVFCQFASQNAPNYLAEIYNDNQLGFAYNQPVAVLDNYWKEAGDVKQLQRLGSSYSSAAIGTALKFSQSSGIYGDDTYLRVKTFSFSYQLPTAFLNKAHMKGAGIFVNAQNLLTFTNYKVGDPETPGSFSNFPVQRILAFGLNLKL
ncbi:SusC/RagA family TonB-linked outer membrane protein [Chitinophaga sp. YR627]|uniref:SusC/RagA family TonB-linked outer membrane protein n=1 Tax=Chitinophaga sp. YR627 TaxID=1881041 RepID=UPI001C432D7F|nr:SusC/RagA family TonB-linked outer membrane protein [Chitinophaga sp. YR627]